MLRPSPHHHPAARPSHAPLSSSSPPFPSPLSHLLLALAAALLLSPTPTTASSSPTPTTTNVALSKPILEVFSGSAEHATSASPHPTIGWFSTAFGDFPDHTLYPETLVLDLLDNFTISAVVFASAASPNSSSQCSPAVANSTASPPVILPSTYRVSVGRPGVPRWTLVDVQQQTSSTTHFSPTVARYLRLAVTATTATTPNYTISVPRICVMGTNPPTSTSTLTQPPTPTPTPTPTPSIPSRLRVESRDNPIDIDEPSPRLSWILASSLRNDTVTAWQVVVNRTTPTPTSVWDTGRVPGRAFSAVYAGSVLRAGDHLLWSVRLWDSRNQSTAWAPPASFAMARLAAEDWTGEWIGAPPSALVAGVYGPGHPAVYLRGRVVLPPQRVVRAVAYFAPLGWGQLYVDGAPASSTPLELSPGYTTYEYRTQYNVIDITRLLPAAGGAAVVLSAVLGDGWYALAKDPSCCAHFQQQPYVNTTRMLLDVDVWLADGQRLRVGSNTSWQWAFGDITSSWFNGEAVDKRRQLPPDWMHPHTDPNDPRWSPVQLLDGPPRLFNGSRLVAQKEPPTVALATIAPQTLRVVANTSNAGASVYIWDLGREVQGRPVLTALTHTSGAQVRIIVCGSMYLFPNSAANLTCDEHTLPTLNTGMGPGLYNFTLAGTGTPETYEPRFTYTAIRRVVVHAPPGVANLSLLVRQIAMIQPRAGTFVSSSDTYNWLHESLARTQINYCTGFPNDPTRERVGYTQDMLNMFWGAAFEFASAETMYGRWMTDMADGQAYSVAHPGRGIPPGPGQMPTVIPGPKSDGANSVWWGGMIVWQPWMHFRQYGDERVLARFYPHMAAYVSYVNASAEGGLVKWGLGDWNSPLPECEGWGFSQAPINTPGLYLHATVVADVAEHLGRPEAEVDRWRALATDVAAAFNAAFWNRTSGEYAYGRQCHQSMALAFGGLVPVEARPAAVAVLRRRLAEQDDRMTVGFVSFLHMVLVLADEDPDAMHRLITRRNYGTQASGPGCRDKDVPGGHDTTAPGCSPSPYSMTAGAVPSNDVMKETWQGGSAVMPSLAGPLLVHSYHTLAGLRLSPQLQDAGWRRFQVLVPPGGVGGLRWVNATYESVLGQIAVAWWLAGDGEVEVEVAVPAGALATVGVCVEEGVAEPGLWESGEEVVGGWWWGEELVVGRRRAFVELGSGKWRIGSGRQI